MITAPMLLKMFLDRRAYGGWSEFRFRPHLFKTEGLDGIDVISHWSRFTAWLRPGTTDDRVFDQIFVANHYNLRRFRPHYQSIVSLYESIKEPLILDLGANIGLSSLYFASNFGRARIVAVEPDPQNFKILQRNTSSNSRINGIHAAVASQNGRVNVIESKDGAWASQTKLIDTGDVNALSVCSLLNCFPGTQPFIVKIDIEGAEEELFSTNVEWLDQFPIMIIETHDWLIPGQATSKNFFKAICGKDRDFLIHGENVFSIANWESANEPPRQVS